MKTPSRWYASLSALLLSCFLIALQDIRYGNMLMPRKLSVLDELTISSWRIASNLGGDDVRPGRRTTADSTFASTSLNEERRWGHGKDELLVAYGDSIYTRNSWDGAPIVMEKYKLVFFTTAKVGCTVWKQLFRRMMGIRDWKAENTKNLLPWNPEVNGLRYLYHYNRTEASYMMTAPDWTRAIIVRDPKTRFLSAYLDKVVGNPYFTNRACCPTRRDCADSNTTMTDFAKLVQTCSNPHWAPQAHRMEAKYWPYINFVGHMENIASDAERLLRLIGAWERFGSTGWGKNNGTDAIFAQDSRGGQGSQHATHALTKLRKYYTPALECLVDEYYDDDYRLSKLKLNRTTIFTSTTA